MNIVNFPRMALAAFAIVFLPIGMVASDKAATANTTMTTNNGERGDNETTNSAPPTATISLDPLLRVLLSRGILNEEETNTLAEIPPAQLRDRLLLLLLTKNVSALSPADVNSLSDSIRLDASAYPAATPTSIDREAASPQSSGPPQPPPTPPPGGPIPAITPIRALQIDTPKREGIIPAVKIGTRVNVAPFGFFKASAVYDSSSPYGNDFPLPGFNGLPNTVNALPEFHVKARFFRFGSNFEWLDTPNVIVTGKVEADFEGNFSRVNNRNISAIRSNALQLRLAYGRVDWKLTDKSSVFLLAGQDWTPFGSSTLPNLFETTGLGVGFGTLYERDPQIRVGMERKFHAFQLGPEFAVVMPAFGNLPADLTANGVVIPNSEGIGNQLGFGERQGADSGRPEIQARLVAQFQLDHAAGVAPAQIIVSGVHGDRTVDVDAANVPAAFKAAFPKGAQVGSTRMAWTAEVQLPTRFFTLIGKYYNGNDLRYYFAGQIFGPFNDTAGLTSVTTAQSIDGSSTLAFGLRNGVPVVANSVPPRAQGGFLNLAIPLSRLAHADPAGRNAGWVFTAHYGYDQVLARDVRRLGGGREKGDMAAGTLQYKLNNFVSFVVEQSLYRTRALPLSATGTFPLFEGRPMREWKDVRTEVGPIFTF